MRRRHELRVARARGCAADPVLLLADDAAEVLVARSGEQDAVHVEEVVPSQLLRTARPLDGELERGDVGEHALGAEVASVVGERRPRQAPVREHEPLDP